MTKYPLKINGVDMSRLCHKRGYTTFRTPVYAGKYTDLQQTDHYVVARWRGGLRLPLNDLTAADAAELAALLMAAPLTVEYHSFDLGKTVTETLMPESVPNELKMSTSRADWITGVTLTFHQL